MAYRDEYVTECLIRLAVNRYDFEKTAEEMGVSTKSLRRWSESVPKRTIPQLLDRAVERMLQLIPDNMDGRDWAVALGILMDKWLLLQGRATARTETLTKDLTGFVEGLSEDERDEIVNEARKIIHKSGISDPEDGERDLTGDEER